MNQPDEFYIGWEAKAAPGIGKTVRKTFVVVLTLALLAPVVLAVSQRMIGASVFEWGNHKRLFRYPANHALSALGRAATGKRRRTFALLHLLPRRAVEIWPEPRSHRPV